MDPSAPDADKIAFRRAVVGAVCFHIAILAFILAPGSADSSFRTLGVYEYDVYDPLGGEPGGGLDSVEEQPPEPEPVVEPEPEPEPEPDPEPVSFVESTSERAEPVLAPPEPREPPKPRPTPTPRPQPPAPTVGIPDGAPSLPGGGPGTGQGGVGGGTGKGTRDAREAYKAQVRRRLERNKKYPPSAMRSHIEGIATVRFTISRDGQVVNASIIKGSGHNILDDEVQALLRRVNPLPKFPPEIPDPTMTLTAPIQFRIR